MRTDKRLSFERLQRRDLLVVGVCNPFNGLDVDDDGRVNAKDALLVVNQLNLDASRIVGEQPNQSLGDGPQDVLYLDTSDDQLVSPIDALLVINHINGPGQLDLPLVYSLSPADDPNGNAVVVKPLITVEGQTSPHSRVRLLGALHEYGIVLADDLGKFQIQVELSPGTTTLQVDATDQDQRASRMVGEVQLGDISLDWNAALLNVVRDWTTTSNDPYPGRIVTSQPPMVARNLAMIHLAMFEALAAYSTQYKPFFVNLPGLASGSPIAAAATAAHRVASQLYTDPDELAVFDATLHEALSLEGDEAAKPAGIEYGLQVADAILAWRANDGSRASSSYVPVPGIGQWNRTFPDYYPPLLPQWPQVKTFAITDPVDYRPIAPPDPTTESYAAAVDEVMQLGSFSSAQRSPDQTEIALFWADGGGTFTPPGHWNQIATVVLLDQQRTLLENARTLAILNVALADAGIAAWDAKYTYDFWRPIDAIRQGENDGNDATRGDTGWLPLLRTPPFPTYTSGHSTFSGAAAAVLTRLLGSDIAFTSRADGHRGFTQRPLDAAQVATRNYTSFRQAAEESGRSRIYGGIHFEFDNQAGLSSGQRVGSDVVDVFTSRGS